MGLKSNCSVICTLFKITFLGKWRNVENVHSSEHSPVSQIATHIRRILSSSLFCFEHFCCDLIRTCGFATCCLTDGTSNCERSGGGSCCQYSSSILFPSSLRYKPSQYSFHLSAICAFVQLQSNFRQLLTGCIADVAETFESLIWLSGRAAWNFLLSSLLLSPRTCLPACNSVTLPSFNRLDISFFASLFFRDCCVSLIRYQT